MCRHVCCRRQQSCGCLQVRAGTTRCPSGEPFEPSDKPLSGSRGGSLSSCRSGVSVSLYFLKWISLQHTEGKKAPLRMNPPLERTHRKLHLRIHRRQGRRHNRGDPWFSLEGTAGRTDVQFSLASFELAECCSDRWAGWKVGRCVGNRDSGWKRGLAVLGAACLLAGRHTLLAGMTLSIIKA